MAALDFSRVEEGNIYYDYGQTFDASIDFARTDEGAVDWTVKTIKMEITNDRDRTPVIETLTSGVEIVISTDNLTFDHTFTELNNRAYWFLIYNDTDDIAIRQGWLIPQ